MSNENVIEVVEKVLLKVSKYDKKISPELKLVNDLRLNSINFISLIVELEKQLGMKLNIENIDFKKLKRVKDVNEFVLSLSTTKI